MSREAVRPYLVVKNEDGDYRVTVRTTRYNSQGYPLVSADLLDEKFATQKAAKLFVSETYRAERGEIAIK
ncbi:hypothetical protein [Sphingomonas radiodurans]|uniref:hypothetical protein n=1 Tax=Sphingomonas radiodurans TaxID=2890321 RepID=UPI001E5D9426|nr:hypothetical protein [Sphingomonas radiodurans]WBH15003.1 hypothetical protein LLW23_08970 [Sphingomonas radiodurans]